MEQKNQKIGYLFLAPLTIIVAVFLLYPFVKGFILSFFETKYGFGSMSFSGLKNFISIVKEEKFGVAIKNSMIWVVFGLILNTVFPMGIAPARSVRLCCLSRTPRRPPQGPRHWRSGPAGRAAATRPAPPRCVSKLFSCYQPFFLPQRGTGCHTRGKWCRNGSDSPFIPQK